MSKQIKKWDEVAREEVFSKYGRGLEKVDFKMPDGRVEDFYIKKEGKTVAVVALTKDKKVIVAKQFRPGPQEILMELPGGGIERGETPEQAGAKELLEETGFAGKAEFVTEVIGCGYSTVRKNCVVITDCEKVAEQKLEENEFIEVVLLTLDEFRQLLRSGKCSDVEIGYLGLDYLGLL